MKVIFCSNDGQDYFGGPIEWLKRLSIMLRSKGVEVVFLLLCDHQKSKCELFNYLSKAGFECHGLEKNSLTQWDDNTEARVQWFVRKTREIKPDIFVANQLVQALYASRWIQASGIPCVGVYHSMDERHRWYDDIFLNNRDWSVTETVFVSDYLKDTRHHPDHAKGIVISCGATVLEESASLDGQLKILYAGKITQDVKRIFDIYDSIKKYIENDQSAIFTIMGGGPDENALLHKLQMDRIPQIEFLGRVSSDEIQHKMTNHNVFILLSEFEGLPLALMEAMAVGLVPISYNIKSGIPELVKNMETGIIVNDREEEVIKALSFLKDHPDEWRKMSENAKRLIRTKYSMDVISDKWMGLFENLKNNKLFATQSSDYPLPSMHPLLKHEDIRRPGLWHYVMTQYNRIKRRLIAR